MIYIKWGNRKEHGIQYYFNPLEILNTFLILNETNDEQLITMTFKLKENQYNKCEIAKNGRVIALENI